MPEKQQMSPAFTSEDVAGKTKGRHHVGGVLVVVLELPELRHLRKTLQNR